MSRSIARAWLVPAVVLTVGALLAGCTMGGSVEKHEPAEPEPNGVAHMKPERAMAVARKAMNELHDAVYEGTVTIELEGRARRLEVVETATAEGCARVTAHPEFGRTWTRIIGRTMWLKANDKAAETLGRTPAQIELLRGRWLQLPAPALVRGCDLGYLLPDRATSRDIEPTGRTSVRGRPGRRFRIEGGGLTVVCVIATEGAPLMLSGRTAGEPGALPEGPPGIGFDSTAVLTDTDTGAEVEPPPDRLVIDPADFQTAPA